MQQIVRVNFKMPSAFLLDKAEPKPHITVQTKDGYLYIEEVAESGEFKTYLVSCTEDQFLGWYDATIGREAYEDVYSPDSGHNTEAYRMSDSDIMGVMRTDTHTLTKFALNIRDKWVFMGEC